jgi:hypothetical protein
MDIDETLAFVRTALENWDIPAAEDALRSALVRENHPVLHFNLGVILSRRDRLDEALDAYGEAAQLAPGFFEAWINQGVAARETGDLDRAGRCFAQALALREGDSDALWQMAWVKFLQGKIGEGWKLSEPTWREWSRHWHGGIGSPVWDGSDISGKRLLVHTDGGFGDVFMMARFLPKLAAGGQRVILMAEEPVVPLLAGRWDGVEVHALGQPIPAHDVMANLSSLPYRLGVMDEAGLAAPAPYLSPDPELVERWGNNLAHLPSPRIGLVWRGREYGAGKHTSRHVSLAAFKPLTEIGGSLVSLQGGPACVDALDPDLGFEIFPASADFMNTAAALMHIDCLVSIDTSLGHLAGALGRQVRTLLPFAYDWRWFKGTRQTCWYETVRLYRQAAPGDWSGPIAELLKDELIRPPSPS